MMWEKEGGARSYLLSGELLGSVEGEVGVRGAVHDQAGEGHGVLDGGEAGHGPAAASIAVHDAGLHLDGAAGGERGAAAGVEHGVGLELTHDDLHDVYGGLVGPERVDADLEAAGEDALGLLLAVLGEVGVDAGPAVDGNSPFAHGVYMLI